MAKLSVEDIKRRRRVVCICRAIPLGRFEDAIASGCDTLALVQGRTGAGRGDCKGQRCSPVILALLESQVEGCSPGNAEEESKSP